MSEPLTDESIHITSALARALFQYRQADRARVSQLLFKERALLRAILDIVAAVVAITAHLSDEDLQRIANERLP